MQIIVCIIALTRINLHTPEILNQDLNAPNQLLGSRYLFLDWIVESVFGNI